MIDHVVIGVADAERSRSFYERALAPLGIGVVLEIPQGVGFGREGKPFFWLAGDRSPAPMHVAFAVGDRPSVDAFHREALAAGGSDNGPPGVREIYHPTYYGAYVLDPDGYNVEAVCHSPA